MLAKTWGYQLQNVDPALVHRCRHDYFVCDWTSDGRTPWPTQALDIMRVKPSGDKRTMLAYVSIGEAETYRPYWDPKASWLAGVANPEWPDNYPVKFEDDAWQGVAMDMLLKAQDSGFDGVYLDKVDVFEDRKMGTRGAMLMMEFVERISGWLKARRPGFLVFPQNADTLLVDGDYRRAIDGLGREDLVYGEDGDGVRNASESTASGTTRLRLLASDGKPILAVEYRGGQIPDALMVDALNRIREMLPTLVPLVTDRQLARLPQ